MLLVPEDVLYRQYMEFFELAERRRRWSVFDDVPWDDWQPEWASPDRALCAETFCAVEMYLPDYVSHALSLFRSRFSQTWFYANWAYEESKHALVLKEYLTRTGQRRPEDIAAFEEDTFSRRWSLPFSSPREMIVYGALQEKTTWMIYRHHGRASEAAGDRVLSTIYRLIGRDEAAHAHFYQNVLACCLELDRDGTLADMHTVVTRFRMPAADLVADYGARIDVMRSIGIDRGVFYAEVLFPILNRVGVTRRELLAAGRLDDASREDSAHRSSPSTILSSAPIRRMDSQPPENTPGCFGCSKQSPGGLWLEFSVDDNGTVAALFSPRPDYQGLPDLLHGGLAATALDETMASVGFLRDGVALVTVTLTLRYLRPIALDGSSLRIEAWRQRPEPTSRQRITGRILSADGEVVVEATGLFVQMRKSERTRGGDQSTARVLPPREPSS